MVRPRTGCMKVGAMLHEEVERLVLFHIGNYASYSARGRNTNSLSCTRG